MQQIKQLPKMFKVLILSLSAKYLEDGPVLCAVRDVLSRNSCILSHWIPTEFSSGSCRCTARRPFHLTAILGIGMEFRLSMVGTTEINDIVNATIYYGY